MSSYWVYAEQVLMPGKGQVLAVARRCGRENVQLVGGIPNFWDELPEELPVVDHNPPTTAIHHDLVLPVWQNLQAIF